MSISSLIGSNLKKLRTSRNLTLKDLSEITGLSIGFLSQLERGVTAVALDTLGKIAESLQVDLNYFLDTGKRPQHQVITTSSNRRLLHADPQLLLYSLTQETSNRRLRPQLAVFSPGSREHLGPWYGGGETFLYVLEGILEVVWEGETASLYPGDSCHFLADTGFTVTNPHPWNARVFLASMSRLTQKEKKEDLN